jgi:radical SAM family uncharacterized protein/radical SAM-linked protein
MPANPIQDLLPSVQMPSRYLGTEINRTQKDPSTVALNVALGFPDLYEIGSSHFGIQILYHILNQRTDIIAERVFAPDRDFEALLRRRNIPLMSLENQRPLKQFDLIGISLLYELNYTNVLNMLDLAGLHLYADQRGEDDPFVIAGGPCVCNPEPMAEFFDAMVFGDAEQLIVELADQWLQWKKSGEKKIDLLGRWSRLEGVYIPRFFKPVYDSHGFQRLRAEENVPTLVKRRVVSDLDGAPFPDRPVIPFGRPVHDRLRLEISRGCSRGCRFCQAGMIYRPVRERNPATLLEMARKGLAATGYEDMSLLSLSTGDYHCLGPLMETLMQRCKRDHVAISLPSLRAGVLTPRLMELIRSVRKTGFTIAPEAGSQRLRDVINKNISYEDVAQTVEDAFAMGWRLIKLYFMIGLPTETDDDLDAIVAMVRKLLRIKRPNGHKGHINVSVTTFIPKSHTPFQWAEQISLEASKAKIARLKSAFDTMRTVRFKWQDPGMSLIEGILARGDRRTSEALVNAWKNGCVFDGWTDHFDLSRWMDALTQARIPLEFFTSRERILDEPLPWDHMDSRVDRGFLGDQWASAQVGGQVADCRHGECHACGVCDFQQRRPRVYESCAHALQVDQNQPDREFLTYELTYAKVDAARFFGHLEMARHFGRAVRRAGIEIKYSGGYHPMPKISFDNPLPLGVESESEIMRMTVAANSGGAELIDKINPFLPSGLQILTCRLKTPGRSIHANEQDRYRVELSGPGLDPLRVDAFNNSGRWDYTRIRHNGRAQHLDLKTAVVRLTILDEKTIDLVIRADCKPKARPADILQSVFKLKTATIQGARVRKLNPNSERASVDN